MFGRATIRLGIGPHSSVDELSGALLSWCPRYNIVILCIQGRTGQEYLHTLE